MPPFEGFDEFAHYSRIRSIYNEPKSAFNRDSSVDQNFLTYKGPWFYSSGSPPFDSVIAGHSYSDFFKSDQQIDFYISNYKKTNIIPSFLASNEINYQEQHPPLYYILLAPLERFADNNSFVQQLDLIRVASYLLFIAGLLISYLANINYFFNAKRSLINITFLIYPLLLPGFITEFARIGNDSLCFLLGSLVFWALLSLETSSRKIVKLLLLGLFLGFGLLSKAFFVPISVIVIIFLLQFRLNLFPGYSFPKVMLLVSSVIAPALIFGGWWYFGGAHNGLGNEINDFQSGDYSFFSTIHLMNISEFCKLIFSPAVTFVWSGTQSLVHINEFLYAPLIAIFVWILYKHFTFLRRNSRLNILVWIPFWLVAVFYFGLLYHSILNYALFGIVASGGWYLHILAPWIIFAMANSFLTLGRPILNKILIGTFFYSFVFNLVVFYMHLTLYSGCSIKGEDKYFRFINDYCFYNFYNNLNILNYSFFGILSFAIGMALYSFLVINVIRNR